MKEIVFKGAGVAIITPFTPDGKRVEFDTLGRLIDEQIEKGTDAIIITGTTGESATMSDDEHKMAIKYTVDRVRKRVPVIAGTGSNETHYAVELSKYAESVGADAVLVVTPYYNKATQKGLVMHYKEIATAIKIPVILYTVPSRTGVKISVETYKELAQVPNIVAVKEASGDLAHIARIRKYVPELNVYSGNDDEIVPILSLGGLGVISVLSNVAPKETHDICEHYFNGRIKEAEKLQVELIDLIDALFSEVNPIPVKTALNMMGRTAGPLRLPLTPMEDANREKLALALRNHGIIA